MEEKGLSLWSHLSIKTVSGNKFFQNIKAPNPSEDSDVANKNYDDFEITKQNVLIDNEFVKKSGSLMTGDLILPHYNYPVQGNTNKAISYETQREIFISRKETFPMETSLDMNNNVIENIAEATSGHEALRKSQLDDALVIVNNDLSDKADKSYVDTKLDTKLNKIITKDINLNNKQLTNLGFNINDPGDVVNLGFTDQKYLQKVSDSNLNMDDHRVINSLEHINSRDLTTKNYVDSGLNAKLDKVSNSGLNMNGSNIKNVGINLSDDTTAVPRSYVDSFVNSAIHNPLDGDLYANNHQIKNLKTPSEDNDAVTKKYFEDQLLQSHLLPSHKDNAFKYLLDQDESSSERNIIVNGIVDFNESPHKNKKAYDIDLIYTQGTQNYDSQIGINIYPLPIGKFTIIMEYYYPENIGITVSCQASTAIINKQISKNFSDYIKLLVQFEDQTKQTPDYLFFNIRGIGTTITSPEGYLVFYGIKEWCDSVNPEIYDHALELSMFGYDNENMKMFRDLDMNDHKIINISNDFRLNAVYLKHFTYRFYDLTDPSTFKMAMLVRQIVVGGINPDMKISYSGNKYIKLDNYDPNKGLLFDNTMNLIMNIKYSLTETSSYTIMIGLTLKDNFSLYFVDSINEQTSFYPKFHINKSALTIAIETSQNVFKQRSFPSNYADKHTTFIIHFSYLIGYVIQLSNATSVINSPSTPPPKFSTNKLRINPGKNYISRIGYQNANVIDDDLDVAQILFEEKKNGSHFE